MQTAETLLAIYGERIRRNQSKDRATGEPDDAKVCAAERGVESLTQSGGARRNAPGSSD